MDGAPESVAARHASQRDPMTDVELQTAQAPVPEPAPYADRFGEIEDLRRHTARGTIVNAIYQVGIAGLSALRGFVAAIFISASDYGVWGLLGLALWTVVGMKQIGVNEKYIQQSESDQVLAFQRAFTIELLFSAALIPATVAIVLAFAVLTGHASLIAPGIVLALAVPAGALQFPVWAFYRRMDFRRQRILQGTEPVLATVVTVALAALGAGYWSLVAGTVLGAWAAAAVALRFSPYPWAWRFDRSTLRGYVSFSAPLVVSGLATLAAFQVIYLFGNEAVGLAGLGAFTVAGNLIQFTDRADTIITETIYPALCAVQDRIGVLFEAFVKSNRLALMWAVPFGVGASLFAADLVHFGLGDRWEAAIGLLQVLGVVTAVHHIGFNWHAFYRARGTTGPIATLALLNAVVVIATAIPLMNELGVVGLGWAFACGEAASFALRMRFLSRLFTGFQPLRHMVRALWPTALAALAVLGLRGAGVGDSSAALALAELAFFIGATACLTVVFERSLLREAIGYMRRRTAQDMHTPAPGSVA